MKQLLRNSLKKVHRAGCIAKEYCFDCIQYIKYNYDGLQPTSREALRGKILRQAHVLEKGMSLPSPRAQFGVKKAMDLATFISEYVSKYSEEDSVITNSLGVLSSYLEFHRERGFVPEDVQCEYDNLSKDFSSLIPSCGIKHTSKHDLLSETHAEFPIFFQSRHSLRQFSCEPVLRSEIEAAVALAMHSPSACNRQSSHVYFYEDASKNRSIGSYIAGNTGFEDEPSCYLVITSSMASFHDAFERNQTYVDAGIFAMGLALALHYYGIGSCVLQNGERQSKNRELREICSEIPDDERIVLFIAAGHYRDTVSYAVSKRLDLGEVLSIN